MKTAMIVIAIAIGLLPVAASAQPETAPDPATFDARMKEAESYVKGPAMKEIFDQMLDEQGIVNQMSTLMPTSASSDQRQRALAIALEEFKKIRPEMETIMIEASAQTFTLKELKAANAFYATPEGQGMVSKTNTFNQTMMQAYMPLMERYMMTMQRRALEMQAADGDQ
ncbi:MAG: DUF2059 domain-containing protein [Pseudomonadota bacterium]